MARRVYVGVRLSAEGCAEVDRLAATETDGERSAMIRKLLAEALAARAESRRRRP